MAEALLLVAHGDVVRNNLVPVERVLENTVAVAETAVVDQTLGYWVVVVVETFDLDGFVRFEQDVGSNVRYFATVMSFVHWMGPDSLVRFVVDERSVAYFEPEKYGVVRFYDHS